MQARWRAQHASELSSFRRDDGNIAHLMDVQRKLATQWSRSRDWQVLRPVMGVATGADRSTKHVEMNVDDVCERCQRNVVRQSSSCLPVRSVPRMGTRLERRPQRTVTACTCELDVVDGGHRPRASASLSDSENSATTLTNVEFHRAWSSDGDAAAAAVDSLSSSEGNSASELSPGSAGGGPRTCSGPAAEPGSGSSAGAVARRLAYDQFARVMYTNRANLQHTIAVQQRLFQQQLAHPAFNAAAAALGPPPLPPRPPRKVSGETEGGAVKLEGQLEWVVRRRADGTRYITRRPATATHRGHRRPRAGDVTAQQLTSSSKQLTTGQTVRKEGSRRKEVGAVTAGAAPERMKEQSQPMNNKSATAFHNIPVTSLRQPYQHPILAVVTI